jgi:hypothetical protein
VTGVVLLCDRLHGDGVLCLAPASMFVVGLRKVISIGVEYLEIVPRPT